MRMVQLGYKVLYMDSDNVVAGNPLAYFNTTWDVQGLADNRGRMQYPTGMCAWGVASRLVLRACMHVCRQAGHGFARRQPCMYSENAGFQAALCASPAAAGAALSHPCHIYVHVKEARQPTGAACALLACCLLCAWRWGWPPAPALQHA
jgi:hypothetical protein